MRSRMILIQVHIVTRVVTCIGCFGTAFSALRGHPQVNELPSHAFAGYDTHRQYEYDQYSKAIGDYQAAEFKSQAR